MKSDKSKSWRSDCPVSCALDLLGDKWSLLIIRDLLLHHTRTYSEFTQSPEGISTNILAARLKFLSKNRVIEHQYPDSVARDNPYILTDIGKDLESVAEALYSWSQKHAKELRLQR